MASLLGAIVARHQRRPILNHMCALQRRDVQRGPMSAPIESIAAMTDQADADDLSPADVEPRPLARPPTTGAVASGAQWREPRTVSPNAIIGLLGTLLAGVLLWALTYMSSQMNSLGDRIDGLGDKIDEAHNELDTKIDIEIGELRAEMRDGFGEVNATLLDHTERLARLETTAGLSRPAGDTADNESNDDDGG